MTSPPDVQNVPDVWGLLERARSAAVELCVAAMPTSPDWHKWFEVRQQIDAAFAVRERFVLVPKETEPSTEALNAGYARYRYAQDSGHDIDWRVVKECIYAVLAAAPKPEEKP